MLRTLVFAPVAALALAVPMAAHAEDFPRDATGSEVRADDGTVLGHVRAVTRDRGGQITSMDIPGLAPPDASSLNGQMVADNGGYVAARVIDMRRREHDRVDQTGARQHAHLR
ncbi:MAG: hypothetical protein QM759_06380 [Terricaulis sp.]